MTSRVCDSKLRYATRRHAEKSAKRMRQTDKIVQAYPCAECRGFHVGSPRFVFVEPKRPVPRCIQVYAGGLD